MLFRLVDFSLGQDRFHELINKGLLLLILLSLCGTGVAHTRRILFRTLFTQSLSAFLTGCDSFSSLSYPSAQSLGDKVAARPLQTGPMRQQKRRRAL